MDKITKLQVVSSNIESIISTFMYDVLKETITTKNEQIELKNNISEYISLTKERFEYYDLDEEFDFEGLVIYLTEYAVQDIKNIILGKVDEETYTRGSSSVVERACSYANNQNKRVNRNKVEEIVNGLVDIILHFYETHTSENERYNINRIIKSGIESEKRIIARIDELEKEKELHIKTEILEDEPISENELFSFKNLLCYAENTDGELCFDFKSREDKQAVIAVDYNAKKFQNHVPGYGGVYLPFGNPVNLIEYKGIEFEAKSNKDIGKLCAEMKPYKREWMHEIFNITLTDSYEQYKIHFENFRFSNTYKMLGEITFVVKSSYFQDEMDLRGTLYLKNLRLMK